MDVHLYLWMRNPAESFLDVLSTWISFYVSYQRYLFNFRTKNKINNAVI